MCVCVCVCVLYVYTYLHTHIMSSTLISPTHPLTTQEAARHLIQDAHEVDEEIRRAKERAANAAAVLRARGVAVGNGKALAMSELISKTAAGEAPRALGAKLARAMREKVLGLGGGVAAGLSEDVATLMVAQRSDSLRDKMLAAAQVLNSTLYGDFSIHGK
jgi:hypothetical protein